MFKVETNKLTRIVNYIEVTACIAIMAIMVFFFRDLNAYFDTLAMKIVANAVYIGCMILMLYLAYELIDHAHMYMIVERSGFRIKHLFRKEDVFTRDQLIKWECYTQYIRTGLTSENIVIYFDNKTRVEFAINENTNFERLLSHLRSDFNKKEA
ncbi:hypothetical protein [Butyrivibrio sp. MC2013]|uniref:hypothetical protein n=1 Tax=Butyrivibrio sp. MC2013 TaxID=1280686 RepID=UPI000417B659|nr:hypothetical protein [Butyrivibrio sp. MC2013]